MTFEEAMQEMRQGKIAYVKPFPDKDFEVDYWISNGGRGDKILSSVFMGQVPAIQTYAIMSNSWRTENETPD